jgi:hypothetical protein
MKRKILCAIGAIVVLLGIAAAVIFGSDEPQRVTITVSRLGGGRVSIDQRFQGISDFAVDPFTGKLMTTPLSRTKDIDVVIHSDADMELNIEGALYHRGDRLTWEDGKLAPQTWLQVQRNDLRYWVYELKGGH